MKLLIVEDERAIAESVCDSLTTEGYICECSASLGEARDKVALYEYDVVLLDIGLPDGSGLELIPLIKAKPQSPGVIVLSARNSVDDRVAGLDQGADDYITKPFHISELSARLKSLIRRMNFQGSKLIAFNEITVNPDELRVFIHQTELVLTKKEFDLLVYFLANKNRIITKVSISEHLWGDYMDTADSYDFIYTHIKNLRKKLLKAGCTDYIKNVYGMGYKFET